MPAAVAESQSLHHTREQQGQKKGRGKAPRVGLLRITTLIPVSRYRKLDGCKGTDGIWARRENSQGGSEHLKLDNIL